MKQELEAKLINEFPKLFGQKDLPPSKSLMCFGCCHDDGWYTLLHNLCEELVKSGYEDNVKFAQIKEKFGTLRIYCDYYNPNPTFLEKINRFYSKYWWRIRYFLCNRLNLYKYISYITGFMDSFCNLKQKRIDKIVEKYELKSAVTCEMCSKFADLCIRGHWYKTLCHDCSKAHGYKVLDKDTEE